MENSIGTVVFKISHRQKKITTFYKRINHTLIVGEYECLAKNKLGTAISTIFLEGNNFCITNYLKYRKPTI